MNQILLVTPPLTQLNTPYPATSILNGFLRTHGISSTQMDLSIELINALFTREKMAEVLRIAEQKKLSKPHRILVQNADFIVQNIEPVMKFLSGRDTTLSVLFSRLEFWPKTKRLPNEEDMEWAFGLTGNYERALHLCTLFLKELSELIQQHIDAHFELIRYAETLCLRLPEFEPVALQLLQPFSLVEELMLEIFSQKIIETKPAMVGFSIPFPGNLFSTLRCAQWLRKEYPAIKIIIGGGYVNTELRNLSDPKIFDYIDFITFDDGELPLLRLLEGGPMIRTLFRNKKGEIERVNFNSTENIPFASSPTPDYDGLLTNNYLHLIELTNPMHALWSNGKWNKMMLSHGCYWGKCTFCDGSLDYISRYETAEVTHIVDQMEQIMKQTGQSGFHFVDEAASPAVLRKLAEELLRRQLTVSYWTNIRFEKSFTPELTYLMAKSGCIAVSGGLEVASPRILKLINKGITIETARESMKNFSEAGIMTHAYLMYGFPTQTAQETMESLDVVRGLFENGWIQSAFWHRYAMTIHSPSGQQPETVGAKHITVRDGGFANNEIPFTTSNQIDLDFYGRGLQLAVYNYMQGTGYDVDLKSWFK